MALNPGRQSLEVQRKIPRQSRARASVEAIFEAAAQIVERDGPAALTTNAIAARAGVSIGTLYQYFANREAILIAMGRREIERLEAEVARHLAQRPHPQGPHPQGPHPGDGTAARPAVRALLNAFGGRHRVRRTVIETFMALGMASGLVAGAARPPAGPMERIAALIAANATSASQPGGTAPSRVALFVLTRAVVGVIRAAVLEGSPLLGEQAFEDELVALVGDAMRRLRAPRQG